VTRATHTKRIPLYRKDGTIVAYARVDTRWYEYLMQWTWRFNCGYARRSQRIDGRRIVIHMSREVVGLAHDDAREADHINRNRLDNRESNLRIADRRRGHRENMQNVGISPRNSSGHRGVSLRRFSSGACRWRAYAKLDGRQYHLGFFDTRKEADRVVSAWRAEHMPFSEDYTKAHGRKR
jgi:hypothetical protein